MMAKSEESKEWYDNYCNDDELFFFVGRDKKSGLVRSDFDYRSVAALIKESGLTEQRVEQILNKYLKKGLVIQSTNKIDHYAYWRLAKNQGGEKKKSLAQSDKDKRMAKGMPGKP